MSVLSASFMTQYVYQSIIYIIIFLFFLHMIKSLPTHHCLYRQPTSFFFAKFTLPIVRPSLPVSKMARWINSSEHLFLYSGYHNTSQTVLWGYTPANITNYGVPGPWLYPWVECWWPPLKSEGKHCIPFYRNSADQWKLEALASNLSMHSILSHNTDRSFLLWYA